MRALIKARWVAFYIFPVAVLADSISRRIQTVGDNLRDVVIGICTACAIYSGIQFARGNPAASERLVMCGIGAIVAVAGAELIKLFV